VNKRDGGQVGDGDGAGGAAARALLNAPRCCWCGKRASARHRGGAASAGG
jgi:hypothetical protein